MTYFIKDGDSGKRLILKGPWNEEVERVFLNEQVEELELRDVYGWNDSSLYFLKSISKSLKTLCIQSDRTIELQEIESLRNLRHIGLFCKFDRKMNFEDLPLESCSLFWSPKVKSILKCRSLKELWISRYSNGDLSALFKLEELESLHLVQGSVRSLTGIEHLKNLRTIYLERLTKLEDLEGLEHCSSVSYLLIDVCKKIGSLETLGGLKSLEHLFVSNCGEIESLHPLLSLRNLKSLDFAESTKILDGDLGALLSMPKLAHLNFANRKHYSHTRREWHMAKFPDQDWAKARG